MPDGPDYTALTRGQIALLDRITAGETGLPVLNQIVGLAQVVLGAGGAEFIEHAADHGRVVAACGSCESALGRRVGRDAPLLPLSMPCRAGDRVVGTLHVPFEGSPAAEHHAVLELLAAFVGHFYSARHQAAPPTEDRDLFVAVTSHELRTPVTVIKGYADTLTNHWESLGEDGRREAVRVVGARAGELARLVDRLLAATSDDGEVTGAPPGPFDLVEALRSAVGELPAALRRRLVLDELPIELPKAFGDRESLATVLTELSTNADKYSPADTEVTVTAEADDTTVILRVADRGVGVRPEHVELAFERYWQGEPGSTGRNPGAGLGLYLVRRIVERQRGWVSLRPRPGGGTVVEVRFPRA
ncbi:sensor histidine kinase KdpD [Actinoplanes sp. N902-109]|uniref:sensor histidine kinase n=1 Tax=Actinoplanes sp. (strain N902-109) TaxID=649831 RepID=UPI0003294DCC|nr:HAMP domain-containing sensor histidine kinase [Actinoplanes sp. N902-109]AGL21634.1 ATP-binding protein [Actinoplanes sp. N902-109]